MIDLEKQSSRDRNKEENNCLIEIQSVKIHKKMKDKFEKEHEPGMEKIVLVLWMMLEGF